MKTLRDTLSTEYASKFTNMSVSEVDEFLISAEYYILHNLPDGLIQEAYDHAATQLNNDIDHTIPGDK